MKNVIRLDKYLADMNIGTRSNVKQMIRKGRVTLNGEPCLIPETKADITQDVICVDTRQLNYMQFEYFMLHKPAGIVTATRDKKAATVLDLVTDKMRKDLFPVGRLDKDTEGLLLITNDGVLCHELLSPKKHVAKTYFARVAGNVTAADADAFKAGIQVDDTLTALPAELEILSSGDISEVKITIYEGKYHQIKRMMEACQKEVIYLKRLTMGPLVLDENLPAGECRKLTADEIKALYKAAE